MKLFLDEGVPKNLERHLPGHEVESAGCLGWKGTRNSNELASDRPYVAKVAQAVDECKPGTVVRVDCGKFLPSKGPWKAAVRLSPCITPARHPAWFIGVFVAP